jgi:prepilin-type N-terminal cleavage/methylation domain-containing protein
MKINKAKGFTLIELMIVVAIIGILAAIAIPKFADLIRKSNEGATKGNLGALRSALSIYYADNDAYPAVLDSAANTAIVIPAFTPKYIKEIPASYCAGTHLKNYGVYAQDLRVVTAIANDLGGWGYDGCSASYLGDAMTRDQNLRSWGSVVVSCLHRDTKNVTWSRY